MLGREPRVARRDPSPYETLETVFGLLTCGPEPLSLDGRLVGHGLPPRAIPLDELRDMMLHPSVAFATRDAAVAELARRARRDGGVAMVGLAGVLLPGLRRLTTPLARACPGKAADLEAAVLAGLVEAVEGFDEATRRPAASLVWAGVRAAHRLLETERAWRARHVPRGLPAEPPRPAGHPDFVLAEAVRAGVVSVREAEVIQTSSPARCSRASRRQSRLSVLILSPGARGISDGAITWQLTPHAVQQPGQLEPGRAGLVTGSQQPGIIKPRHQPADRRLVVADPLHVGDLLVGSQDPDRDGVLVDVQAEMNRGEVRDTGHGRLLPYVGSARLSVGDPRRCGPEPAVLC
jgi:hypothetical protein